MIAAPRLLATAALVLVAGCAPCEDVAPDLSAACLEF